MNFKIITQTWLYMDKENHKTFVKKERGTLENFLCSSLAQEVRSFFQFSYLWSLIN